MYSNEYSFGVIGHGSHISGIQAGIASAFNAAAVVRHAGTRNRKVIFIYNSTHKVLLLIPGNHDLYRPYTNKFYKNRERGIYECLACGRDLFSSATKYDSGSGWPAFYDVIDPASVKLTKDASHGKWNKRPPDV